MINEVTFNYLLKSNEGKNFTIKTNIANGRGINGINYDVFYGCWKQDSKYTDSHRIAELRTSIEQVLGCGIIIKEHIQYDRDTWRNGERTTFIPFESIVSISFNDTDFGIDALYGVYPKNLE